MIFKGFVFPLPANELVVSHPVIACKPKSASQNSSDVYPNPHSEDSIFSLTFSELMIQDLSFIPVLI